jgi:predicted phosphoribosyltransferase
MWYEPIFTNRRKAGQILALDLKEFENRDDVIVLALPRGGVPIAFEVAKAIKAPLDVFVVRKLGVPGQEELAFGAIATGGVTIYNEDILRSLRMPPELIELTVKREEAELKRREELYRGGRPPLDVAGKTVIVVDDGLATGASMAAAVEALQRSNATQIIVAVPVASKEACRELRSLEKVRCICVETPEPFFGVGVWYQDFSQTTDDEVQTLLLAARSEAVDIKVFSIGK